MPFRNTLLRHYAETREDPQWRRYGEFKESFRRGHLLLGFGGEIVKGRPVLDYNDPVYVPFADKSDSPPAFLFLGKRRAGKTTIASNIFFHQLYKHYRAHTFVADPKAKLASHKYAQTSVSAINQLSKAGLKPWAVPMKTITPKFLERSRRYKPDQYYMIGMQDFNSMRDEGFKRSLIKKIFKIEQSPGSDTLLDEILSRDPQSMEEMAEMEKRVKTEKETRGKFKAVVFANTLRNFLRSNVLGDNMSVDIVELMQKYVVNQEISLAGDMDINSTYVAIALNSIKEGIDHDRFDRNIAILLDEADKLAPSGNANPPSKNYAVDMYTKWGADHVIPGMIAQDNSTLERVIEGQIDYLFAPNSAIGSPIEKLISGMSSDLSDKVDVSRLFYGDQDVYPKQWLCIDPNRDVFTFFPTPSPSMTS